MARIVTQIDGGRLTVREGGGGLALFGLPFLAAGLFLVLGMLDVIPMQRTGDVNVALGVLLGLAFAIVGGILVAGRAVTTIDITQQTVAKEWRLLLPLRTAIYQLADYQAVTVRFTAGDSDSADRFPVGLKPAAGLDLSIAAPGQYAEACSLAAAVARHVGLDVEDDSSDHPSRVSASEAELPLAQRERSDADSTLPPRPAVMRSEITEQSGETRISIPAAPLNPLVIVAMELPAVVALAMLFWLLAPITQRRPLNPADWIFFTVLVVGFVMLPSLGTVSAIVRARVGRTIVAISPAGIRIDATRLLMPGARHIATIDTADILGVDFSTRESLLDASRRSVEAHTSSMRSGASTAGSAGAEKVIGVLSTFVKGQGVIVKTRAGVTKFGEGLADEEIKYLRTLVVRALVR